MSVVSVCGQSDPTLSASPTIVTPGDEITVTYSGAPGFDLDWIAIYEVGDPNEWYGEWYYLYGEQSGTLTFTAPEEPGDYEFRLFENDGYTDIAWSNVVSVQVGTTVSTPAPTATTPTPTDYHSIQSYNYPDYYIRHRNSLGEITTIVSTLDKKDATFKLVPGLADSRYVSFESVNYPGYYLRHQNSQIKLHKKTDDELFKKDSTFKIVPGLADSNWVSFESYNYPDYFIRHKNGYLYIEKGDTDLFRKDTTFRLVTPEYQPAEETPAPTITPPEFSALIFESRSKPSGSTVQIPLTLKGIEDKIGNMDITLSYDPSVLEATEVIKGGLTTTSLFEYNLIDRGTIKISLADKVGFSGDGSIAYVKFNVIGSEGSVSPLKIVSLSANRAEDMAPLSITTQDGVFTVLGFAEGKGDCDGDEEITAADALCALVMAVGKIPEDLAMDVNGDGSVTSLDASEILKLAIGEE